MEELPVLFLPGTLCTPDVFKLQVEALAAHAPRIEAVRFTTQDSIAAMAEEAIKHIPAKHGAAIVGFSMGGMVAMEVYRRVPSRVSKLALLNSNHHADLPARKAGREMQLEQIRLMGMEQVMRQHYLPNCLHRPSRAAEDLVVAMAVELGVDFSLEQGA